MITKRVSILGATGLTVLVASVAMAASAPPPSDAELLRAYLPKDDLGVSRFLSELPTADGRGVLVAILDTGIDLHHAGLLRTPSGERKIVDVYDATDNGLVDLPLTVTSADTTLPGWTGRTLHLGPHRAEDHRYRLGRLSARQALPEGMTNRLLNLREEARRRSMDAWESRIDAPPAPPADEDGDTTAVPANRAEAYREARRAADRAYDDPGPAYDLVAFRRDAAWRLVIDADGDGNLAEEAELLPYRERGDLALFSAPAELSVALASISEDGGRASLMFDEGGHGTHVAGIVGAYYGSDDPMNGLAPGVRFLAVKIGNGRLGGGTSHNAIASGITWAVNHGAMVANISFGGTSHFDDGREVLSRYLDEVVQNHGIFITMSAGNEGPGLSTVGAAGTARRVFTLGAAISPLTMLTSYGGLTSTIEFSGAPQSPARHSLTSSDPARGIRMFGFSSRGPLANGSAGVDFVSPGAAVSPLPTWLLTRNENWNGTSMAAPQTAGCISLLLSAALEEKIAVSPARVDRAMRAAAIPLPGVSFVEQGAGLIQLPEAFDALRALARAFPVDRPTATDSCVVPQIGIPATRDPLTGWRISTTNPTGTGEGVYDRNETATAPYWRTVYLAPDLPGKGAEPLRTRFLRVVRLESTVPWMEAPPQTSISANGTSLRVRIDPGKLQPGLNGGQLRVRTVAAPDAAGAMVPRADAPGTEIDIPFVLVRPEYVSPPDHRLRRVLDLPAGERRAIFVAVPDGATRMSIRVKETAADPANAYSLAVTAIDMRFPPPALRSGTGLTMRRDDERTIYQRVEGGTVVEVALFARWVNPGPGALEVNLAFAGIQGPGGMGSTAAVWGESKEEARWGEPPVTVPPGRDGASVPLHAGLADTHVNISARLDGRAEPLELVWSTRPDTVHPVILEGGRDALLALGGGRIRLDRGESVTCDLRQPPELEDLLDDCFFRLFTPSGQEVDDGNISYGPFEIHAPDDAPGTGWYRLEISIFGIGREFLHDTAFLSPEIIRGGSYGRVTPFADPVSARAAGADSSWSYELPRGWARNLYLRVRDVPDNGVFTGSFTLRDREDAPPLLRVPLRVDTRAPSTEADRSLDEALDRLEVPASRLLAEPPVLSGHDADASAPSSGLARDLSASLEAAVASLKKADDLQRLRDGEDAETTGRWCNRTLLACDLRLRHAASDEAAQGTVARLLEECEKRLRKDLPEDSDRRRAGKIGLRRAALALSRGDAREAREEFDSAERLGFGGDAGDDVRSALLLAEGKPLEALSPLRAALAEDPWNPRLVSRGVNLFLDLGWIDLADEWLATWPDRFPQETAAFFELMKRRGETNPAAETRPAF